MQRFNQVIELIETNQPVYYISTSDLTYLNGKSLADTWADYIRIDLQHAPLNMPGVQEFMKGVCDYGRTRSGHTICPVVAELPSDGTSEEIVRANSWQIRQLLACGVFGLILCHAETVDAVRALVEHTRFASHNLGVGNDLGPGRRGVGGHETAASIWSISVDDYMEIADVWPLNPNGEILLGVKMENKRALENCEDIAKVPGIAFGEWGLADMSNSFGYASKPTYPLPAELDLARHRVWRACKDANIGFLQTASKDNYKDLIDQGLSIIRVYDSEIAELGRRYSNRQLPW